MSRIWIAHLMAAWTHIAALARATIWLLALSSLITAHADQAEKPQVFSAPLDDSRVVSLSWELTESLLAMGITPLAAADAEDYRRFVVHPTLPPAVLNVGTRLEPNLEVLVQLRPSAIVITPLLADIRPALEAIAPVVEVPTYGVSDDNVGQARRYFLALARDFGHEAEAHQALERMNAHLSEVKARLLKRYPQGVPSVQLMRFNSPKVAFLYGTNSLPVAALRAIGSDSPDAPAGGFWGAQQREVSSLSQVKAAVQLYFSPFPEAKSLFSTPLWQAMPFVQQGCSGAMPAAWPYGGIMSLGPLADAIEKGLSALPEAGRLCQQQRR